MTSFLCRARDTYLQQVLMMGKQEFGTERVSNFLLMFSEQWSTGKCKSKVGTDDIEFMR